MPAYSVVLFTSGKRTVAILPAVAPDEEAAMDAAEPWVRQAVAETGIRPLWYRAVPRRPAG